MPGFIESLQELSLNFNSATLFKVPSVPIEISIKKSGEIISSVNNSFGLSGKDTYSFNKNKTPDTFSANHPNHSEITSGPKIGLFNYSSAQLQSELDTDEALITATLVDVQVDDSEDVYARHDAEIDSSKSLQPEVFADKLINETDPDVIKELFNNINSSDLIKALFLSAKWLFQKADGNIKWFDLHAALVHKLSVDDQYLYFKEQIRILNDFTAYRATLSSARRTEDFAPSKIYEHEQRVNIYKLLILSMGEKDFGQCVMQFVDFPRDRQNDLFVLVKYLTQFAVTTNDIAKVKNLSNFLELQYRSQVFENLVINLKDNCKVSFKVNILTELIQFVRALPKGDQAERLLSVISLPLKDGVLASLLDVTPDVDEKNFIFGIALHDMEKDPVYDVMKARNLARAIGKLPKFDANNALNKLASLAIKNGKAKDSFVELQRLIKPKSGTDEDLLNEANIFRVFAIEAAKLGQMDDMGVIFDEIPLSKRGKAWLMAISSMGCHSNSKTKSVYRSLILKLNTNHKLIINNNDIVSFFLPHNSFNQDFKRKANLEIDGILGENKRITRQDAAEILYERAIQELQYYADNSIYYIDNVLTTNNMPSNFASNILEKRNLYNNQFDLAKYLFKIAHPDEQAESEILLKIANFRSQCKALCSTLNPPLNFHKIFRKIPSDLIDKKQYANERIKLLNLFPEKENRFIGWQYLLKDFFDEATGTSDEADIFQYLFKEAIKINKDVVSDPDNTLPLFYKTLSKLEDDRIQLSLDKSLVQDLVKISETSVEINEVADDFIFNVVINTKHKNEEELSIGIILESLEKTGSNPSNQFSSLVFVAEIDYLNSLLKPGEKINLEKLLIRFNKLASDTTKSPDQLLLISNTFELVKIFVKRNEELDSNEVLEHCKSLLLNSKNKIHAFDSLVSACEFLKDKYPARRLAIFKYLSEYYETHSELWDGVIGNGPEHYYFNTEDFEPGAIQFDIVESIITSLIDALPNAFIIGPNAIDLDVDQKYELSNLIQWVNVISPDNIKKGQRSIALNNIVGKFKHNAKVLEAIKYQIDFEDFKKIPEFWFDDNNLDAATVNGYLGGFLNTCEKFKTQITGISKQFEILKESKLVVPLIDMGYSIKYNLLKDKLRDAQDGFVNNFIKKLGQLKNINPKEDRLDAFCVMLRLWEELADTRRMIDTYNPGLEYKAITSIYHSITEASIFKTLPREDCAMALVATMYHISNSSSMGSTIRQRILTLMMNWNFFSLSNKERDEIKQIASDLIYPFKDNEFDKTFVGIVHLFMDDYLEFPEHTPTVVNFKRPHKLEFKLPISPIKLSKPRAGFQSITTNNGDNVIYKILRPKVKRTFRHRNLFKKVGSPDMGEKLNLKIRNRADWAAANEAYKDNPIIVNWNSYNQTLDVKAHAGGPGNLAGMNAPDAFRGINEQLRIKYPDIDFSNGLVSNLSIISCNSGLFGSASIAVELGLLFKVKNVKGYKGKFNVLDLKGLNEIYARPINFNLSNIVKNPAKYPSILENVAFRQTAGGVVNIYYGGLKAFKSKQTRQ